MSHPKFPNMPHLVEVELDPTMHDASPEGLIEEMSWAAMDTAWNLLRDTAARVALQNMREVAAETGIPFPATDEELFQKARDAGVPDVPTSHRDLAPWDSQAMEAFSLVFQRLVNVAINDSAEGLRLEGL